MSEIYRFGISLEKPLIDAFDKHIEKKNYKNRSEAIRDLIRNEMVQKNWVDGGRAAGAIVMTYDHHKRELLAKITDIQHDYQEMIISTQHVHLDHHNCLEIIAVRGEAADIQSLADKLQAQIGVKHLNLSVSATLTKH
ncbi:MAG: nickel-responsive transcriptional regulator NikR [Fibrobacteres bacterium]|nr:nickel-responsive transcriptional regulator NikR [Fibrobacterota bacterium]